MDASKIQKLTGALVLGPSKQDTKSSIHNWIRVGNDFINYQVRVPLALASLLRKGEHCTIWLARLDMPTPLLFKTHVYVVYAIEQAGVLHNCPEDAIRSWRAYKWVLVAALVACTIVTLVMYIWPLFLINTIRMTLVNLPVKEMRSEPVAKPLP